MQLQTDYPLTDADFKVVQDVVYKYCGISLNDEKTALVRARLTKQIRMGGYVSAAEYLKDVLADRGGPAFSDFIDAISTNLTSFFRENDHFKFLSESVLPRLLAEKRMKGTGRIVVWSAACSSGEEPYSLAMTILEAIRRSPPGALRWEVRLLATDISTRMLTAARAGVYTRESVRAIPQGYQSQYFTARTEPGAGEECYTVSPELKQIVRFRHLNLMDAWPFSGPFDFIFCRNVMIYFDQATQQQLVRRFWDCIAPGGFLFTGHSESLTGAAHRFTSRRPSIYEKSE
jgi:chemotaxis protein methyltransferase CheR